MWRRKECSPLPWEEACVYLVSIFPYFLSCAGKGQTLQMLSRNADSCSSLEMGSGGFGGDRMVTKAFICLLKVREGFLVHQALTGCQDPWVPQVPHLWITVSL